MGKHTWVPHTGFSEGEDLYCISSDLSEWKSANGMAVGDDFWLKEGYRLLQSPSGRPVHVKPGKPEQVQREVLWAQVGASLRAPVTRTYAGYDWSNGSLNTISEVHSFETYNASGLVASDMTSQEALGALLVADVLTLNERSGGDMYGDPLSGFGYAIDNEWSFGACRQNSDVSEPSMDLDRHPWASQVRQLRDLRPALLRLDGLSVYDLESLVSLIAKQLCPWSGWKAYPLEKEAQRIVRLLKVRKPLVRGWLIHWISKDSTSALWAHHNKRA